MGNIEKKKGLLSRTRGTDLALKGHIIIRGKKKGGHLQELGEGVLNKKEKGALIRREKGKVH